jgi:16S rRNA (guanine1207-N2)-methyltransferase
MRGVTADHYFSIDPAAAAQPREFELNVVGRRLTVETAAGVFSAERLDPGTALLLRRAPLPGPDTTGALLDLGCGYGPIALALATAAPRASVYAVDVNRRALDLMRRNARANEVTNIIAAEPDEVDPTVTFDQIWSNPPIRIGKAELHAMLGRWLPRLAATGTAWLVVARNLGADSLQRWLTEQGWPARRHASAKGYRILRVGNSDDAGGAPAENP